MGSPKNRIIVSAKAMLQAMPDDVMACDFNPDAGIVVFRAAPEATDHELVTRSRTGTVYGEAAQGRMQTILDTGVIKRLQAVLETIQEQPLAVQFRNGTIEVTVEL